MKKFFFFTTKTIRNSLKKHSSSCTIYKRKVVSHFVVDYV
jgi:hypothetical protein